MKFYRVFLLGLFFFPGIVISADNPSPTDPVNFVVNDLSKGMYSFQSANQIPDNAAVYIENFFTDIEGLGVERSGSFQEESTVLGNPNSISGLWSFLDVNNVEWLIGFSSKTFYKKQIGGTFTPFGYSATVTTNTVVATINLGKIWFVDGKDVLWWFDGTSTGTVSSAPIGSLITSWRNRLAIGNVAGSQSIIRFSADGDGTNWTLGPGDSDPFTIQIGGANDGYPINCLYGMYQDTLMIGRKFDLWGTYGFTQSDEQTRKLSSEVGCIQNNTMKESDGDLIWLSARGLERLNGTGIQLISDPVRNLTDFIVKNTANQRSNTQQLSSDWGAGTSDNGMYVDTITFSNAVQLTFPDTFDLLRDGTMSTKNVWTSFDSGGAAGTPYISGGLLYLQNTGGTSGRSNVVTTRFLNSYTQGTTYHVLLNTISAEPGVLGSFQLTLSSQLYTTSGGTNPDSLNNHVTLTFFSTSPNKTFYDLNFDGVYACTRCSVDIAIPTAIDFYLSTTTYQVTLNNVISKTGTHTWPNNPVAAYLSYQNGSSPFTFAATIDSFGITPETATFTSQLLNTGSAITNWAPVYITDSKTGTGSIIYSFGSTNTASVGSISNFTSISNGLIPSVSTNPYAAFKALFSNQNAVDTASLSKFITTWSEGALPPNAAWTWDRRYWLSFTTNTATGATLNKILVYQRNKTFTLLSGLNAASFTRWRDNLYFGDSTGTTGLVYLYDTGNSDNGNAITSILVTKSYDVGFPYRDKDLKRVYAGYLGNSGFGGSFSLAYDIERSGSAYSLGTARMNEYNGMFEAKFPFPQGNNPVQGREVQYVLTKTGTGDRLKLYEMRTMLSLKEAQ